MKGNRRPLNRSVTIGCILFILALCVLLSMANLKIYKDYVYQDYRDYISYILNYTMEQIDGDDLKKCIETREESEKYKETQRFMDRLIDHFDDIHYFYAILPLNTEETGNTMSVFSAERYYDRYIDTEGNLYLGWISDDEFDAQTAAQFFEILHGDGIVYFEEDTEWGTDFTGATPIRDSDGNSVAVLAVDIDISFIHEMIMRYALLNICIISLVGILFIGAFLFWLSRSVTRPIKQLEKGAVGFANHSHGQRDVEALCFDAPELKTNNEIKSLSDAVVKMTEDMRDYVSDIISAEKKAANLQELANKDALTGVRNKAAYDNEIRRIEEKLGEGETKIGLAIVDLNSLKRINDTYGHDKGNVAICKLCSMICAIFEHSPVFRVGGDEFVIILRAADYDRYEELQARFEEEIEALRQEPDLEPWERISAAVGAAFYDETADDGMASVFRRADHVMYDRKKEMKAERRE